VDGNSAGLGVERKRAYYFGEILYRTSLQQRLVKTGGRLVKHARYHWLMLAESHLTRRLFAGMVRRIDALALATG
jgi:hypothetical protein